MAGESQTEMNRVARQVTYMEVVGQVPLGAIGHGGDCGNWRELENIPAGAQRCPKRK